MSNYSIGEFSNLIGISKRMLRHYDKINLIKPDEINSENGYRFYHDSQINEFRQIEFLRSLGFSLVSVKELLSQTTSIDDFLVMLIDKELELTKTSDEIKSNLLATKRIIMLLEQQSQNKFSSVGKLLDWERSHTVDITSNLIDLKSLMNRDLFMEKIEDALVVNEKDCYHFLTFDIDMFMNVNDRFGFDVGDAVIVNVMSIIYNNMVKLEASEILSSRFGGDEMAIFLKNAREEDVKSSVLQIMKAIKDFDFKSIGCDSDLTISVGVSYGMKAKHVGIIMDTSGKALIEAKRSGRNQFIYKVI